jgi:3-deoxy-D-manno-octulosonic-acid transferase
VQLYRIAISAFAPIAMGLFGFRTAKGAEDKTALAERIGRPSSSLAPTIWLHGASNGELHSARPPYRKSSHRSS